MNHSGTLKNNHKMQRSLTQKNRYKFWCSGVLMLTAFITGCMLGLMWHYTGSAMVCIPPKNERKKQTEKSK